MKVGLLARHPGVALAWTLVAATLVGCSGTDAQPSGDLVNFHSAVNTTVTVTVKNTSGTVQVGVSVNAQKNGTTVSTATTNAQGIATFSLAAATYKFRAAGQGTAFYFFSSNCTTPDLHRVDVTTTIPVVVTVADPGNTPQANLEVMLVDANGNYANSAWTDANGHASLSGNTGSYRFATPGDGEGFMYYSSPTTNCTIPGCTTAAITWTQPVAITVVDTNGAAQPDTEVLAQDSGGNYINLDYTDAQGHASLSVPVGTFHFVIPGDGTLFSSPACTVAGCTTATITLPLVTTVTVVDKNAQPVVGQTVLVQDANGNVETSDNTDASGTVGFQLAFRRPSVRGELRRNYYTSGALGSCLVSGCVSASIVVAPCTTNSQCSSGVCSGGVCCSSRAPVAADRAAFPVT